MTVAARQDIPTVFLGDLQKADSPCVCSSSAPDSAWARAAGGMDPLGARSRFVDIQTLATWQQQLDGEGGQTRQSRSDGPLGQQAFPSPFPFRPEMNRRIFL